jgi:hypothetical protein
MGHITTVMSQSAARRLIAFIVVFVHPLFARACPQLRLEQVPIP